MTAFHSTHRWQKARRVARIEAGHRCSRCGKFMAQGLHVHHQVPVTRSMAVALEPLNLSTACPQCHNAIEPRTGTGSPRIKSGCDEFGQPTDPLQCIRSSRIVVDWPESHLLEAKNMGFKPSLTEAQWSKVSALLPEKRRGRQMIEAVLYRTHTGESLATVSEAFGIKKARLHQWEHAITHELPAIMAALRLERAGPLAWCRSGSRPTYHNNLDMMASIAALRMQGFRAALRSR